jgi:two-component system, OmpR family, phosphate regulon sensor histidine kinase PhoR
VALPIRTRLFLAFGLVVTLALAAVTLVAVREQREWMLRLHTESLERSARIVERDLRHDADARAGDWPAFAARLGAALECRVTLVDSLGRVRGDSSVPPARLAALDNHASRPEIRGALQGRVSRAVRPSATLRADLLYVAIPVRVPGVAVARVSEPLADLSRLTTALLGLLLLAAAGTLLVALAVVFRVADRQAERVRALESVAHAIGAGAPDARALERPADELGRLGAALNRMAGTLRGRLEALEGERDERERILAHMTDGVALVDGDGRVVHMNRALATLLAAPLPAAPGTPLAEFVREPELDEVLEEARAAGRTVEREVRLWTAGPRSVRATVTPLAGPGRAPLLLVAHDLTEVERLDRMRQDFVANVSHELRTPLTSLRGYAETLLDGGLEDAEHREGFVRVIRDQATRLEALVEDLLSLAALERPGTRLHLSPLDLRALAAQQVATFRPRAEQAGLALALEPGEPQRVEGDRARLEQVLANLLDNALKYTERGEVRVAVGGDDARVWCEVRDTGSGIPAEDLPRIFERFYRVDKARSRDKGGTGLGLSIVKHIVALHGGEVTVESAPGAGSAFRVTLPRAGGTPLVGG